LSFNEIFIKYNLRLNSLLLADEFRTKVLEDALKFEAQTPNDFEWSPLQYVTQNDDQTQKSIRNLDQLRKLNQKEKENVILMDRDNFEIDSFEENTEGMDAATSGIVCIFFHF
jgi:hypothetical protein